MDGLPLHRLADTKMCLDFSRHGRTDLSGLTSGGLIYYSSDLSTWVNVGTLSQIVMADFNGDGQIDLAGLTNRRYFSTIDRTLDEDPWRFDPTGQR
jgi:hypothetical protein